MSDLSHHNFLVQWNNRYPLDYWWRKKYNIPFNSPKHRAMSYIDIFYEWLEEKMYEDAIEREKEQAEMRKLSQTKRKWLVKPIEIEDTNHINSEELLDKFDALDVSAFNDEPYESPVIDEQASQS